eukprot:PLAT15352.1.p1 GENE.PLAT15352.1~~PLAT15352.1.p1  ORF type:complete len:317 (-),score=107.06 PLAT15352.1:92-1042(-)
MATGDVRFEEQLVLRLPERLAARLRELMAAGDLSSVWYEAEGDPEGRRFQFHIDGTTYAATLVDLPCIVEVQKTLDKEVFYKSGDIGQMLRVLDESSSVEEQRAVSSCSGLTPPTESITRHRYGKVRKRASGFAREEVADVEDTLKLIIEGTEEVIEEQLVDELDYMRGWGERTVITEEEDLRMRAAALRGERVVMEGAEEPSAAPLRVRLTSSSSAAAAAAAAAVTAPPRPAMTPSAPVPVPAAAPAPAPAVSAAELTKLRMELRFLEAAISGTKKSLAVAPNDIMRRRLEERLAREAAKHAELLSRLRGVEAGV